MTGNDAIRDNDVLRAVNDSVSAVPTAGRPAVAQIRHRSRAQRRRRLLPAAGALVTAGAAALAVTVALPASHQPQVRLDAWTVSKQANGDIQVTINQLQDPSGLQSTLRADGVPASVAFGQQNPACQHYPQSSPMLLRQVLGIPAPGQYQGPAGAYVFDINPSALPGGAGVAITVLRDSGPGGKFTVMQDIVYT
ncbi:MAG: hypothetical protein ACR2MP_25805, partial [Streptosporangiaceae bacterium]